MASRKKVEQLLSLPYFTRVYEEMIQPMVELMVGFRGVEEGIDSEFLSRALEKTNRYVFDGICQVMASSYAEIFTDEEVEWLHGVYQHPTFLKLQANTASLTQKTHAWIQENNGAIDRLVEEALDNLKRATAGGV